MIQSQHSFWIVREACSDTTDGRKSWGWTDPERAVEICEREREREGKRGEREEAVRLTPQTERRTSLAAACFYLLIHKSPVIRMRGREHVA